MKSMVAGELFSQLSLWWFKLCLTSCTFCLYLILYLHFTCVNPNPQSSWIRIQYGSGSRSTTLADNVLAVNSWGLCLVDNFLAMVITFWPPSICRESCRERPPLQIVHYDKIKCPVGRLLLVVGACAVGAQQLQRLPSSILMGNH